MPLENEKVTISCDNCKHSNKAGDDYPCNICCMNSNHGEEWEGEEDKFE